MQVYNPPVEETLFLLKDVLGWERHAVLPGFSELTPDVLKSILGEAARLASDVMLPLNQTGDRQGCRRRDDGSVAVPDGFREAFGQYGIGGWIGLSVPEEHGGQGLPFALHAATGEYFIGANMALAMFSSLTHGAITAIIASGSEEQKRIYLPRMIQGVWTGTMNLTEPHAGTDLGLLRTRAVPKADGSYRISGQKIFISAGEHDIAENIVHLVLARIEGAPAGTKGISLFLVPKFLVNADGSLGDRNDVNCGAIERKMGIHGNPTCVMNYDGAVGYLLGRENKGLATMFVMMNEARLDVATQGLALGEAAYQSALNYARERRQGRSLVAGERSQEAADPIIVHPDIRRMLMTMRGFNEAGRAFLLWAALQSDLAHRSPEQAERERAAGLLGLVTPILKGVLTDKGFEHAVMAQQIFGGHGYIEENGVSQYVRDARIAMIYEGTNGIQALDLVRRKLFTDGGAVVAALIGEIGNNCRGAADFPDLARRLRLGLDDLEAATRFMNEHAENEPDKVAAAAYDYMHLFGLVMLGHFWLRIVRAVSRSAQPGAVGKAREKAMLADYFMRCILPETQVRLVRLTSGAECLPVATQGSWML